MNLNIAIAQFQPTKADPAANLSKIEEIFGRIKTDAHPPDVLLFPEACVTGYFLEGGVRESALTAPALATALGERYAAAEGPDRPLDVAIGFYEESEHRLYNSAMYVELGDGPPRIVHVHRKVFLPTYGVFQEERFVEPGHEIRAFDTRWGQAAMLICEDMFHSISPMLAALDGAQVLLVPSASPARGMAPGSGAPGNLDRWERIGKGTAEEHGIAVAVAQLTGFEGGKGFAGGSMLYGPRGELRLRLPLWDDAVESAVLDLDELTAARTETPLLSDLERALPRILQSRRERARMREAGAKDGPHLVVMPATEPLTGFPPSATARTAEAAPVAGPGTEWAHDPAQLEIDPDLVTEWLVRFLRDEVRDRRGFDHVVVGLSGGVDSALTAALCARALGPEAVTGFLMPYRTSSAESEEHGLLVAERYGIEARRIEISDAVDGYLAEYEAEADDTRRGNVMARMRMIVLFDQSAKLRGLPIGTGNKSERLMGYFTWHADDSPPINPLGDLFKTQVWALARHLDVPSAIIDKPATADLIRGQTDEQDLGVSYPEADLILHHLLSGRHADWLVEVGFDADKVAIVSRRLESTHWKRNLPTVAMLSGTTIGEWYLRPVDY
jgi:NAD+ synthetase